MLARIVYLNGEFIDISKAKVSVLDRGFLYGDGVFETISVYNGTPFHLEESLENLKKSLQGINLNHKVSFTKIHSIIKKLFKLNNAHEDAYTVYIHITRGYSTERNINIPVKATPTIFISIKPRQKMVCQKMRKGFKAITTGDIRWKHGEIRSIARIAQALLLNEAHKQNAVDTILLRDGYIKDGSVSSFFMVKDGTIFAPSASESSFGGVTHTFIVEIINILKIPFQERPIKSDEIHAADEIWLANAERGILPIIKVDKYKVGDGKAGPVWEKLIKTYLQTLLDMEHGVPWRKQFEK